MIIINQLWMNVKRKIDLRVKSGEGRGRINDRDKFWRLICGIFITVVHNWCQLSFLP